MLSIPSTYENPQPSYQELSVRLSIASKRISFLEEENKQLRRKLHWREQLDRVSNTVLSTGERTTLRVTMQQVNGKEPDENGYYLLDLWKIGKDSGQSDGTVGKHLKQCAQRTKLFDRYERKVPDAATETGFRTEIWIKPDFPLIATPNRYTAIKARNHGGDRKTCPSCQSKHIRKKTTYTCMDCGTIFDEKITDYEDGETEPPPQNQVDPDVIGADFQDKKQPDTFLSPRINLIDQKPARPPCQQQLEETTKLLVALAGDASEHISMPGGQGKKYTTIHRSLTVSDIEGHLAGTKTVGATLSYTDGTTRALCFDTDDTPNDCVPWQQLQEAASVLIAAGYTPLLEPSPAGRGGHLWIIFSERVNARAAYTAVCASAPILKGIVEYWPGRGNQKVRLPAGKYVTPDFSSWTHLVDAIGREIKTRDLPSYQTPASLLPVLAPREDKPEAERTRRHTEEEDHKAKAPHRSRTPDAQHRGKYKEHSLWVAWPDETYLIARFNKEHTIDELAVQERNGMINAGQIGRPENTASVAITQDGQRFTDFGASARNPDGSQDGGDAFEFYCRSQNLTKSEALQQLGRTLCRQASQEILRAARAGEIPASWVMEMITPAGRDVYNENALRFGHQPLDDPKRQGG